MVRAVQFVIVLRYTNNKACFWSLPTTSFGRLPLLFFIASSVVFIADKAKMVHEQRGELSIISIYNEN